MYDIIKNMRILLKLIRLDLVLRVLEYKHLKGKHKLASYSIHYFASY